MGLVRGLTTRLSESLCLGGPGSILGTTMFLEHHLVTPEHCRVPPKEHVIIVDVIWEHTVSQKPKPNQSGAPCKDVRGNMQGKGRLRGSLCAGRGCFIQDSATRLPGFYPFGLGEGARLRQEGTAPRLTEPALGPALDAHILSTLSGLPVSPQAPSPKGWVLESNQLWNPKNQVTCTVRMRRGSVLDTPL